MQRVIVAFEHERNGQKIKEIIESEGLASCILCRSAAEVKRLVRNMHLGAVVCGFKLSDDSCQSLRADLPGWCAMLVIAMPGRTELLEGERLFKLSNPVKRGELLEGVRQLLLAAEEGAHRPQRSAEEVALVDRAKALLMTHRGMSEEEAHRYLRKRSMDTGAKLIDTARQVLDNL